MAIPHLTEVHLPKVDVRASNWHLVLILQVLFQAVGGEQSFAALLSWTQHAAYFLLMPLVPMLLYAALHGDLTVDSRTLSLLLIARWRHRSIWMKIKKETPLEVHKTTEQRDTT